MTTPVAPMSDPVDPAAPAGHSPLTLILIAVAALAAIVIGGGAFAVVKIMGGGGDQPSTAMPDTTAVYAQVDIDPSVGQKVAALKFFDGMDTKELEEMRDGQGREALFDWIAEDGDNALSDMDYEEDVEPWLGDRAGVGVVSGATTEDLVPILAIQVKDEAAAESFLNEVVEAEDETDDVEFFFRGDYAVFAGPAEIEGVKQALDAGTLADSDAFTSDVSSLGEQGIVSMWADLPAFQELSDSVNKEMGMSLSDAATTPFIDSQAELEGRLAATLRFEDDAIELYGAAFDSGAETIAGGDSAHLISTLPEDTAAAFGIEHGDQYVDQVWTLLEEAYPNDVAEVQQEAAAEGFNLPEDVKTLVGDSMVIAAGPEIVNLDTMDDSNVPVGYQAHTDADAAVDLIDRVIAASGEDLPVPYGAEGDTFIVAGSEPYYDALAGGGDLGSNRAFELSVPDADDADVAAFVSLNEFESAYLGEIEDDQERTVVESMAAVGMRASSDGEGGGTFSVRLVFDE